ncbi:hypothetical protein M1N49_01820 [Thermodesulfovibrionales bacterium]|nr:hypothetical protein [Thermodesulfovibrionales bacterium]
MTEDRGISGLHKVTGIRGIGSAHTSPKAVVKKKRQKNQQKKKKIDPPKSLKKRVLKSPQ